jgi:hypothetical protein
MNGAIIAVVCIGFVVGTISVLTALRSARYPDVTPEARRRAAYLALAWLYGMLIVFALVAWLVTRGPGYGDARVWLALSVLVVEFGCACLGFVLGARHKNPAPWAGKLRTDAILGIASLFVIGPVLAVLVANRVN